MIFIIGGEGFVGQAYVRLMQSLGLPHQVITRANREQFVGHSCDVLINANGNSRKFLADNDPVAEFEASVVSVVRSLADFKADRYVFLSSGDVYPTQNSPDETSEARVLDTCRMSRYGLHKYMAEMLVLSTHPKALVMRMGGFVGPGMKKNAIFDMLNDQPVWLAPESELQFISTDTAASAVWELIRQGVFGEVVNLGATGTISLADVHRRLKSSSSFKQDAPHITFEISTEKLTTLLSRPLPSSKEEVDNFLSSQGR